MLDSHRSVQLNLDNISCSAEQTGPVHTRRITLRRVGDAKPVDLSRTLVFLAPMGSVHFISFSASGSTCGYFLSGLLPCAEIRQTVLVAWCVSIFRCAPLSEVVWTDPVLKRIWLLHMNHNLYNDAAEYSHCRSGVQCAGMLVCQEPTV